MNDRSTPDGPPLPSDGFTPASRVTGEIRVPESKSIAQRLLVGTLLAHGTTEIEGLPQSDDVMHALRCARAAGATFPSSGKKDDLLATALLRRRGLGHLTGAPPGAREGARPWCTLEVGESGTAARLFTAACALARPAGSGAEIVPSGTLAKRTSPALFAALRGAGVGVEQARGASEGGWPVLLTAAEPPTTLRLEHPGSSQEVSGLLFALAAHPQERTLEVVGAIPSRGYVDVTVAVLESFGVSVHAEPRVSDENFGELFHVKGPMSAPRGPVRVEADASAAAVALAAGALSGGAAVHVPGVGIASTQPDAAITRHLAAFGVVTSDSCADRLAASGEPTRGADVDCADTPDLAPVLAAVGAFAARRHGATTRLTGLETLPGKESSRIEVLARGFGAIGLDAEATDRTLTIAPGGDASRPEHVALDPSGDHRMAFAFALLSLFEPGIHVSNSGCVGKSWPRFWSALETAGAVRATLTP